MNTLFPSLLTNTRRPARSEPSGRRTRSPHYESTSLADAVELTVYLPGVDAFGVEIVVRGPDLVVTGRKRPPVRVNFAAAHLEAASSEYELRLRLGRDLDYGALAAELSDGVLRLRVPKRLLAAA